jgi:hypothetical protein
MRLGSYALRTAENLHQLGKSPNAEPGAHVRSSKPTSTTSHAHTLETVTVIELTSHLRTRDTHSFYQAFGRRHHDAPDHVTAQCCSTQSRHCNNVLSSLVK